MKYMAPEIEVISFNDIDVIQTSGDPENSGNSDFGGPTGKNELPGA